MYQVKHASWASHAPHTQNGASSREPLRIRTRNLDALTLTYQCISLVRKKNTSTNYDMLIIRLELHEYRRKLKNTNF